ncbi:MAG: aminotransferase class I/II-fold pyridoxal phosphate-dependent enzyme [Terriglobales bacterium]
MALSRRSFLQRATAGAGAATLLQLPLARPLFASPEPTRSPQVNGEVQIDSNENPYGPLPSAMKAMQQTLLRANRYPDFGYHDLISAIAVTNGVKEDQVILGAGSTELLRIAALAFSGPGKNIIVADPTFEALQQFGTEADAATIRVPLTSAYAHDLDVMLQRAGSAGLIYICNPNNPTASITPATDIETFISKTSANATILIDEAYHHFAMDMAGYRSFMDHAGDRVVILRTFSKIYGMAGMRLGYGIASSTNIKKMSAFRLPIDVNIVVAAGGVASLADDAAKQFASQRNAADRAEFLKQAASRNVTVIPSYANFLMVKTGKPAKEVITGFRNQNVLIGRPFPPMLDWVRVSLGLPDEMKTFWSAWDKLQA